jgi:hypothetical protein
MDKYVVKSRIDAILNKNKDNSVKNNFRPN